MYLYKGMSTLKIAEELNKRNIEAPAIYLKIPTCMKRKSKNPSGYIWQSPQIVKMLKNQVYLGSVVGRKFQKVSHKVEKVRALKKAEYIIIENMHEPIIDNLTWRKAQDKINKHQKVRTKIYEQPFKEFVYCAECGSKATYRVRSRTKINGESWEQKTFICSYKNNHKNDCKCKPIDEKIITEKIKQAIKEEIEKIDYTENEIMNIYKIAEEKVQTKTNILNKKILDIKNKIQQNEKTLVEIYQDKIQKIISVDDFNIIYKRLQKEKKDLEEQIHQIETEILELKKENTHKDYIEMIKLAKNILNLENPSKEMYSKLIKKIEFDSNKNVIVTLTFGRIPSNVILKDVI